MTLGLTQPLNRNEYQEYFLRPVCKDDNLALFHVPMTLKSGILNLLEPSGLEKA
jgi:hypothetical protein